MRIKYSKEFEKSVRKLSGKTLNSVRNTIFEVRRLQALMKLRIVRNLSVLTMSTAYA